MRITYKDGTVPEPINQSSKAPAFSSGNEVFLNRLSGKIKRIAIDKSWLDIEIHGWTTRLRWNKEREEYF